MPVEFFLETTAIINLIRLREERFDREYSQFVETLKSSKLKAYIPSSVVKECEDYLKSLRLLSQRTMRKLKAYLASRTLADRYLKPSMFLILEEFFINKINESKRSRTRQQLGLIQEYVSSRFLEALNEKTKIPEFLRSISKQLSNHALNILYNYDRLKSDYPPEKVKCIPEVEEIISNKLKLKRKNPDNKHLAGLCHHSFKKDVWCILITTDFTHLLNHSTFNVCWVRCVRPRYAQVYLKIYRKTYGESPIDYIRSGHTILSKEQNEILDIIEDDLGLKIR